MKLSSIKLKLEQLPRTSFGVSVPHLRKLAQHVAKDNYREFLDNDDYSSFKLKLLHAFVIGYAQDNIDILLVYLQKFIPYVDDWAINDALCQNFKIARKYRQKVWNFILMYQSSDQEFISRIISVMLLSHFLEDEYIDDVIKVLDRLNTDKYYAQMGVAWAVATIMGKYPAKCLEYLQSAECHLDIKTYNKSLQKIRESYKVSSEIKKLSKTLTKIPH